MTSETTQNTPARYSDVLEPRLMLVAWEIARGCNLYCAHCRASASNKQYEDELSTEECFRLVDQIAEVGKPILILTGGEPLIREDVYEIGSYAASKGIRVAMGTNGTMITSDVARRIKEIPIPRVAISLDFPTADLQDDFRGQNGAFDAAMKGIQNARNAGVGIQINTTVTKLNAGYLEDILQLAIKVGATAFHPFMLVPTGRGKGLEEVELSPREYEDTLTWVYDRQVELGEKMFFKPTDAPHYVRIMAQKEKEARQKGLPAAPRRTHGGSHPGGGHPGGQPDQSITRGCLAGTGFVFVSHQGKVQGCGYLIAEAGNVREQTFGEIWEDSPLFNDLRDLSRIKGKCGVCEYKRICGGCRARAYEATGDYLEDEPYCIYQPAAWRKEREEQARNAA